MLTVTSSSTASAITVVNNCDSSILSTTAPETLNGATTPSITVRQAGTFTVTSTVGACVSPAGSGVAAPKATPAAPTVTINIAAGTYRVNFTAPVDYIPTKSNAGNDDDKDSDPVNGTATAFTLSGSTVNNSVDAGFISTIMSLGNKIWYDGDDNGIRNLTENGVAGVPLKLYKDDNNDNNADGAAIAPVVSDAYGFYLFQNLKPGNYIAGIIPPAGYRPSSKNGGDPDNDVRFDNNGFILTGTEVRGNAVTLTPATEPAILLQTNTNSNGTYDFALVPDCSLANTTGNLLSNGSFESGTASWTGSGGTFSAGNTNIACGTKNGSNKTSNKSSLVYQDVTMAAGKTVTLTGFAGVNQAGLAASPKLSLIFRNAGGTVLGQTAATITFNTDANFGQLAFYKITATTPAGTTRVRVQSSISNGYMKFDGLSLRTGSGSNIRTANVDSVAVIVLVAGHPASPKELTLGLTPNPAGSVANLDQQQ